ncbi:MULTISPECIES: hypothetical protein [Methylobacterium]|uniref:hypothetical protein n=1 Tax=Methylobacterium TaxID=407 RepID=UPI001EE1DB8E|nr:MULTISPECIES: hypothetical protein [Methylobacterium]
MSLDINLPSTPLSGAKGEGAGAGRAALRPRGPQKAVRASDAIRHDFHFLRSSEEGSPQFRSTSMA